MWSVEFQIRFGRCFSISRFESLFFLVVFFLFKVHFRVLFTLRLKVFSWSREDRCLYLLTWLIAALEFGLESELTFWYKKQRVLCSQNFKFVLLLSPKVSIRRFVGRFLFLDMEDGNERKVSREMLDMADRGMSDEVLNCVMPYIHDPKDRDAVSLVCRRWYELDALTRKHITIALCYTTTPGRLRGRFPHLESLKLKGKPRAAMFNLIMEDWGGYVTPWVKEISDYFDCLKSLHFRRMIVKDSDLQLLAQARGRVLLVLKLDKCSGFSTDGLLHVGRSCR